MSYVIKIIITAILMSNAMAGVLKINYEHIANKNLADEIKLKLITEFEIPSELISTNLIKDLCKANSRTLCLNKKGELQKLSSIDIKRFSKTFSVFKQEAKDEN